jgi:hypothetical protein
LANCASDLGRPEGGETEEDGVDVLALQKEAAQRAGVEVQFGRLAFDGGCADAGTQVGGDVEAGFDGREVTTVPRDR